MSPLALPAVRHEHEVGGHQVRVTYRDQFLRTLSVPHTDKDLHGFLGASALLAGEHLFLFVIQAHVHLLDVVLHEKDRR